MITASFIPVVRLARYHTPWETSHLKRTPGNVEFVPLDEKQRRL